MTVERLFLIRVNTYHREKILVVGPHWRFDDDVGRLGSARVDDAQEQQQQRRKRRHDGYWRLLSKRLQKLVC